MIKYRTRRGYRIPVGGWPAQVCIEPPKRGQPDLIFFKGRYRYCTFIDAIPRESREWFWCIWWWGEAEERLVTGIPGGGKARTWRYDEWLSWRKRAQWAAEQVAAHSKPYKSRRAAEIEALI